MAKELDEHEKAISGGEPIDRKDGWYIGVCAGSLLIVWGFFIRWWLS